jgi:hypothetical protein
VQKVAKEDVFECVLKTLKELKDQEKLNKLLKTLRRKWQT